MVISSEYMESLNKRFEKPTTADSEFQETIKALMDFMGEQRNVRSMFAVATVSQREGFKEIYKSGPEAQKRWAQMVWDRRFKYWCGRTSVLRGNKKREIHDMIARCRDAENPRRAFNARLKLLREKVTHSPLSK